MFGKASDWAPYAARIERRTLPEGFVGTGSCGGIKSGPVLPVDVGDQPGRSLWKSEGAFWWGWKTGVTGLSSAGWPV